MQTHEDPEVTIVPGQDATQFPVTVSSRPVEQAVQNPFRDPTDVQLEGLQT